MTPIEEAETLMNAGIQHAGEMLEEHGEFFPYGAALNMEGQVIAIAAGEDEEDPSPESVVDMLNDSFRAGARSGDYKATALFINVTVQPDEGPETDAVMVALEHRDGERLNVYFPYSRSDEGVVEVGELFAEPREGVVFSTE